MMYTIVDITDLAIIPRDGRCTTGKPITNADQPAFFSPALASCEGNLWLASYAIHCCFCSYGA